MLSAPRFDPGSFRDPTAQVFEYEGRILRAIYPSGFERLDAVLRSGLLPDLCGRGWLIGTAEVEEAPTNLGLQPGSFRLLEHAPVPFLSYPYEWSFSQLKAAALLHLDIQIAALQHHDISLSDASAYNVQFVGSQPVFIDALSFRPYRTGEYWLAHRQFCEQFLAPLVLTAATGVSHSAIYRGMLDGLALSDVVRLLPARTLLSPRIWMHLRLPARFESSPDAVSRASKYRRGAGLPREAYLFMLRQLRKWIAGLKRPARKTTWQNYELVNPYSRDDLARKTEFVRRSVASLKPALVFDLGCNTGAFSEAALEAGAGYVVGFEPDPGALERAYERAARLEKKRFLPLNVDLANPSPAQGWDERERKGVFARRRPDAVLALAIEHHLAIGRNIPIERFVVWLAGLADSGVVEFVGKDDPMVRSMLSLREDVFDDYSEQTFVAALERHATILEHAVLPSGTRTLYRYTAAQRRSG